MNEILLIKQVLSYIRKNDYAHAGGEEAIKIMMRCININPADNLLDVGSGLGGTANYLNQHIGCKVTGIDIEPSLINYAHHKFVNNKFILCDSCNCSDVFVNDKFDIIYHFNSFYCFTDQEAALREYYKIAKSNSYMLIFDYSSMTHFTQSNPFSLDKSAFNPINLSTIKHTLLQNGWNLEYLMDLSQEFNIWYNEFVDNLEKKKQNIVDNYGTKIFNQIYTNFTNLIRLFKANYLGGCIIYAKKVC